MKFSMFLKQKSEVKERFIPFLNALRHTYGVRVEHIRCDNADENCALEDACIEKDLGIIFEYKAPGTPQQNGVVEIITPSTTTAIGPPIESRRELRQELRGIDI